jgi:hypothetical protein
VKYALHRDPDGVVVSVDGPGVVCSAGWSESLSGRQQRFDGFVSENDQRGERLETGWQRLVAACPADAADDLFAPEFLEIMSGATGAVLRLAVVAEGLDPRRP